jgi:hypothetical protein
MKWKMKIWAGRLRMIWWNGNGRRGINGVGSCSRSFREALQYKQSRKWKPIEEEGSRRRRFFIASGAKRREKPGLAAPFCNVLILVFIGSHKLASLGRKELENITNLLKRSKCKISPPWFTWFAISFILYLNELRNP